MPNKKTTTPALTLYEKMGLESPISKDQLLFMLQETPKEHIYKRPGKGGGQWDYVTGTYVKKVLNYVFGWNWDFTVVDKGREGNSLWVQGRLTIRTQNGQTIIKEQFGRADIKASKGGGFLDYGNDLKAATTDALKKCASELGIASDVYGKEEFKQIEREAKTVEVVESPDDPATEAQLQTLQSLNIMSSQEPITKGEFNRLMDEWKETQKT